MYLLSASRDEHFDKKKKYMLRKWSVVKIKLNKIKKSDHKETHIISRTQRFYLCVWGCVCVCCVQGVYGVCVRFFLILFVRDRKIGFYEQLDSNSGKLNMYLSLPKSISWLSMNRKLFFFFLHFSGKFKFLKITYKDFMQTIITYKIVINYSAVFIMHILAFENQLLCTLH